MLFVPNVFTYIDIGFAIPIAYDNCISHFFANLFATIFFAKKETIYIDNIIRVIR